MGKKKKITSQEYLAGTKGKGIDQHSRTVRFWSATVISLSIVGIVFAVAIVAFTFVFFLAPVQGTSMMTALNATGVDTDKVIVNRYDEAEYGDVIVSKLYYTHELTTAEKEKVMNDKDGYYIYIIKRLIAKPGDTISIEYEQREDATSYIYGSNAIPGREGAFYSDFNYYILRNGMRIDEDYLSDEVAEHNAKNFWVLYQILVEQKFPDESGYKWTAEMKTWVQNGKLTVPENYWFFMGDNRGSNEHDYNRSLDCIVFGPQLVEYYMGKEWDVLP